MIVVCEGCGETFDKLPSEIRRSRTNFCTRQCRVESQKPTPVEVSCSNCGELFLKEPRNLKRSASHYCSLSCAAQRNNRLYPKRKRGKGEPCATCGDPVRPGLQYCSPACWGKQRTADALPMEEVRLRKRSRAAEWRRQNKRQALDYKGGACLVCGYNRSPRALQFHHLDPTTKEHNISLTHVGKKWSKVKEELDKCVLLCGNCHAEAHDGLVLLEELVALEERRSKAPRT